MPDLNSAQNMIDQEYADPRFEVGAGPHWGLELGAILDTHTSVELYQKLLAALPGHSARDMLRVAQAMLTNYAYDMCHGDPDTARVFIQAAKTEAMPHLEGAHFDVEPLWLAAMLLQGLNQVLDRDYGFVSDFSRLQEEKRREHQG